MDPALFRQAPEVDRLAAVLEHLIEHFLDRLGADRQLHAPGELDEHFLVRLALTDSDDLLLAHDDVAGNRREAAIWLSSGQDAAGSTMSASSAVGVMNRSAQTM